MHTLKNIFSSSGAGAPYRFAKLARGMPYELSTIRWHLDTRPAETVLLLHDLLASRLCWSVLHNRMAPLIEEGLTPAAPLHLYAPQLRHHRRRDSDLDITGDDCTIDCYAADVVAFYNKFLSGRSVHLVGHGFGAYVAIASATALPPNAAASITVINAKPQLDPSQTDASRLNLFEAISQEMVRSIPAGSPPSSYGRWVREKLPIPFEASLLLQHLNNGHIDLDFQALRLSVAQLSPEAFSPIAGHLNGLKCSATVISNGENAAAEGAQDILRFLPNVKSVTTEADLFHGCVKPDDGKAIAKLILQSCGLLGAISEDNPTA